MPTKYLCIDDETDANIAPFLESLRRGCQDLDFAHENPKEFDVMISFIKDESPDGLLLDLRLDDLPNSDGKKVKYKATSLAQELRTKMTEGTICPFPIVLWSVDGNYKKSYERDKTAHDIFDAVYYKGHISDYHKKYSKELMALCDGYSYISKKISPGRVLHKALDIDYDELCNLDPRIGGVLLTDTKHYPIHIYVQFLLKKFLKYPGPVVDEALLAARLGIDIKNSKDWGVLCSKHLKDAEYTGAFSALESRWWMHRIDRWWNKISSGNKPLRSIPASLRAALISQKTKLKDLVAAKPIEPGYSDQFWTVCKVSSNAALAPQDGVAILTAKEEWQENEYVSLNAVFERKHTDLYKISPLETSRITRLIKKHKDGN